MIRAVTFDAAGTLFTVAEPVGRTYARFVRRRGFAADPARVESAFRGAFTSAPALAFPGVTGPALALAERTWWRAIVTRALGEEPASSVVDDVFDEIYEHYARAAAWRLDRETLTTLGWLRGRGFRLGVVSNFDSRLPRLLSDLGLAEFFDVVVWSAGAGSAKPDRAIFDALLVALGTRAEETLHVGDDEELDLLAARRAGLRALWLDPRRVAPDDSIVRLADLLARL